MTTKGGRLHWVQLMPPRQLVGGLARGCGARPSHSHLRIGDRETQALTQPQEGALGAVCPISGEIQEESRSVLVVRELGPHYSTGSCKGLLLSTYY